MSWWQQLFKQSSTSISHDKVGRNDPCWCGSGKKYKRCHLESDLKKQIRIVGNTCSRFG